MLNDVIRTLSFLQPKADDDFVDQLHYYYTSTFLIVLAVLVSFKMFAGRPMECWIPADYTKHWGDFAEMYCWAQNTYWLPYDEELPDHKDHVRDYRQISYYQWVPFFLLFQAMFFYTPCLLWRFFNVRSGVIMQDILAVARDPQNIHPENRQRNIEALAVHLESVFDHRFKLSSKTRRADAGGLCRYCNMRYFDGYMTSLYIFVKALYLINVTGQLFLLNSFLQTSTPEDPGYTFYGAGVLLDLLRGKPWQASGYFPRITMCDMQVRTMANVQRHTVQCVLALNIFTEKIFVLLWLLYTLLVACTVFNLLFWLFESYSLEARTRFLLRHLELAGLGSACTYKKRKETGSGLGSWRKTKSSNDTGEPNHKDRGRRRTSTPTEWLSARWDKSLAAFSRDFVKLDGAFVLRMLTAHAGVMFTAELVEALYQLYDDRTDPDEHPMNYMDPAALLIQASMLDARYSASSKLPSSSSLNLHQVEELEEEEAQMAEDREEPERLPSRKEGAVQFLETPMVKPLRKAGQSRSSLMTLSTRQSLQQRRLSVKRMANRNRSASAAAVVMPSYV